MNRCVKHLKSRPSPPAYREAFQRLDAALEQNTPSDNPGKIRLMRQVYFADVDEFQKTGKLVLPK
jgi:hypothetical protein